MYQLSTISAHEFVKRQMDELFSSGDTGMLVDPDSVDTFKLVQGCMEEAAVSVQNAAPAVMLDGISGAKGKDFDLSLDTKGVVKVTMLVPTLRLVSFRMSDSPIILTEVQAESSPQGRMQLNRYVRGVPDDPRLVLLKKWAGDNIPVFNYYSTEERNAERIGADLEYLPYPYLNDGVVEVSRRLDYAILNKITAIVLANLSEMEKSKLYDEKVKQIIEL